MRRIPWFALAGLAASAVGLGAQAAGAGQSGQRHLMPREQELALARSAAPSSVSGHARILVLTDSGFVEGAPGTNGVTCMVNRSWVTSLEPACYDPEASATVLQAEIFRTEAYHRGRSKREVEADLAARLADGRIRLPGRPALVYMMSSGQQLVSDEGVPVGKWHPHLMLYVPYLTNEAVGLPDPPDLHTFMVNVSDAGRPWATLVVPVQRFVDP